MIYSKRGTLYDTSDQSEHRLTDPGEEPPDEQRWDNEGGEGGGRHEAPPAFRFAGELTSKPAWSVLSLAELNAAILRETQAGTPHAAAPRAEPAATPTPPEPGPEGNAWEYAYAPPHPPDHAAAPGFHA